MTKTLTPDICVIGAGSGGLTVAAVAAAFNVPVVLIEKGKMGGDCLNYGCVPSKALIAAGKQAQAIRDGAKFGISAGDPVVDFEQVHKHVHDVIAEIAPHDSVERFEGLGVTVIQEAARFIDHETVQAGDVTVKARRFVIATGSSAALPPVEGLDDVPYLTNETVFDLTEQPEHLIVIGGGPIGMELAQAHHRLGSRVTVLEAFKALGKDDPELTSIVLDRIRSEGVDIREGVRIARVESLDEGIRVVLEHDGGELALDGDRLLVAAGRAPNITGLGLDEAGIKHDKRSVLVDRSLRTSNRKVYAIGDVIGGLQFTHVASYHATLVIQQILFRLPAKEDRSIIPWATYTDPEIAHIGLTEEDARKAHGTISVLRWPYSENDRAQAEKKTTGLIKIITDKKGRILGVSIVGDKASEMINMWSLVVSQKQSVGKVKGFISPYPTMTEIGKRAAVTFFKDFPSKPLVGYIIRMLRVFG
ncbi:dihydrolipoyl dehydrogenase family protein [Coralliovum pocilloporae]|uniref:dihydrolipoyl dehydrogenase family protein n=1 Tax=Coralliovum pocilloporae TaxID=3066369 RepID=UPI0033076E0F